MHHNDQYVHDSAGEKERVCGLRMQQDFIRRFSGKEERLQSGAKASANSKAASRRELPPGERRTCKPDHDTHQPPVKSGMPCTARMAINVLWE